MDRIQKIKEAIQHLFNDDVILYDLSFVNRDKMFILETLIHRKSSPVDLELCSEISNQISLILDELDCITEEYYLEVSSAGAEREIRNEEELLAAINQYVYVKLDKPIKGVDELLGTLKNKDSDGNLTLEYFVKGVKKTAVLSIDEINYISHAVKV